MTSTHEPGVPHGNYQLTKVCSGRTQGQTPRIAHAVCSGTHHTIHGNIHVHIRTYLPNLSCIALALAPNSGTSSTPPSYPCLRRPLSSLVLFFTPFVNFLLFSNAFSFNLISVCSFHFFFFFFFFIRFAFFFWQNCFLFLIFYYNKYIYLFQKILWFYYIFQNNN